VEKKGTKRQRGGTCGRGATTKRPPGAKQTIKENERSCKDLSSNVTRTGTTKLQQGTKRANLGAAPQFSRRRLYKEAPQGSKGGTEPSAYGPSEEIWPRERSRSKRNQVLLREASQKARGSDAANETQQTSPIAVEREGPKKQATGPFKTEDGQKVEGEETLLAEEPEGPIVKGCRRRPERALAKGEKQGISKKKNKRGSPNSQNCEKGRTTEKKTGYTGLLKGSPASRGRTVRGEKKKGSNYVKTNAPRLIPDRTSHENFLRARRKAKEGQELGEPRFQHRSSRGGKREKKLKRSGPSESKIRRTHIKRGGGIAKLPNSPRRANGLRFPVHIKIKSAEKENRNEEEFFVPKSEPTEKGGKS